MRYYTFNMREGRRALVYQCGWKSWTTCISYVCACVVCPREYDYGCGVTGEGGSTGCTQAHTCTTENSNSF